LQWLVRLDAAGGYEGVEVGAVEAYVPPDLQEGDAPLGDEAAYEPGRRVETFGCFLDAEQAHNLAPFFDFETDPHALSEAEDRQGAIPESRCLIATGARQRRW